MAIGITDKFKPKNDANFALMDAEDIEFQDGRLPDYIPICLTQEKYDALKASGNLSANTPYLIVEKVEA